MPNYRLTLGEDLPANAPSRLQVRYVYNNGAHQDWWVDPIGPDTNTAVVVVACAGNLINQVNVSTRTLIAHYPVPPVTREIAITSVQPPMASEEGADDESDDSDANLEATPYGVTIQMSQETVDTLNDQGYFLYGFKAVRTTGKGVPAVWFESDIFGLNTDISWTESYQAYTSLQKYVGLTQIKTANSYNIDLNQTLNVQTAKGTGSVDGSTGVKSAICISNLTDVPFTCGISQLQDGEFLPLCAFPLNGGNLDVIAPIAQVLLMFATQSVNTGAVIEKAFSRGIIIDLTAENHRTVVYDVNKGWSWGGGIWAKQVPPQTDLVPLLIQSSPSLLASQVRGS